MLGVHIQNIEHGKIMLSQMEIGLDNRLAPVVFGWAYCDCEHL